MNWYFSAVSAVCLVIVSTLVTLKVVEPRLGVYTGTYSPISDETSPMDQKGLKAALIAFLTYIAVIVVLCITGVLADENGSLISLRLPSCLA